jgi:hypothetical protein
VIRIPIHTSPTAGVYDEDQDRVDQHRHRHGDAVGTGEVVRIPESDDKRDDRDQQHPVDERHVDLADRALRRVQDRQAGAIAHLDRRARQRERAGDHRLRRDDRRRGREDQQRHAAPLRRKQVERVLDGGGIVEDQRALSEIIE